MEPTGTALGAQDLSIGYPARGRKGGRLYAPFLWLSARAS